MRWAAAVRGRCDSTRSPSRAACGSGWCRRSSGGRALGWRSGLATRRMSPARWALATCIRAPVQRRWPIPMPGGCLSRRRSMAGWWSWGAVARPLGGHRRLLPVSRRHERAAGPSAVFSRQPGAGPPCLGQADRAEGHPGLRVDRRDGLEPGQADAGRAEDRHVLFDYLAAGDEESYQQWEIVGANVDRLPVLASIWSVDPVVFEDAAMRLKPGWAGRLPVRRSEIN